ncbi:MAG: energy-coupling factor ABC transporter ATP-binding protein [Jatrophihabitantaceae bacterium]
MADHAHGHLNGHEPVHDGEHVHVQQIRHIHPDSVHGRPPVPPTGEPILVCRDVRYSYLDRFVALDGVDLTVHRGEKLALLGANGCGKSTMLKILDGLIFPSGGTVTAYGEPVTEDSLEDEQMNAGFRSRIGFVFQNSDAQVFSPTVREELSFGPLQLGLGLAEINRRIEDVLELLQIGELAERAPFQLSGGQKKRVAIGTVLAMNPEVLLFDEPTAALDPRTSEWLTGLIEDLAEAGKTIVLATHDLDSLERIADRCVVFSEQHRIVAEGTPAEVLSRRDLLLEVNLIHLHTQLPVPVYAH